MKLLVILFALKLYAEISIFKYKSLPVPVDSVS